MSGVKPKRKGQPFAVVVLFIRTFVSVLKPTNSIAYLTRKHNQKR